MKRARGKSARTSGLRLYDWMFKLVLQRIPAETAHMIGFALIRMVTSTPACGRLFKFFLTPKDPILRIETLGCSIPGPLGLAAGFDKDAVAPAGLAALGFGFIEVGTVTTRPQPGNSKPRLHRLPKDRALINRMGFNNNGAAEAARRLANPKYRELVIGVNIGKSAVVPLDDAVADYETSAKMVMQVCSYLVVNVSSPNTAGLRDFQQVERLRPLLQAVKQVIAGRDSDPAVALLIKISPDISNPEIDAVADLALELGLDGIIASNTTIAREDLLSSASAIRHCGSGGLSGRPLKARATEVLQRLYQRVGGELVLISCGGIETSEDAWERICAGATLIQAYTGFVYGGPLWPSRIHADLAAYTRMAGFTSIQQAVGSRVEHAQRLPAMRAVSGSTRSLRSGE